MEQQTKCVASKITNNGWLTAVPTRNYWKQQMSNAYVQANALHRFWWNWRFASTRYCFCCAFDKKNCWIVLQVTGTIYFFTVRNFVWIFHCSKFLCSDFQTDCCDSRFERLASVSVGARLVWDKRENGSWIVRYRKSAQQIRGQFKRCDRRFDGWIFRRIQRALQVRAMRIAAPRKVRCFPLNS